MSADDTIKLRSHDYMRIQRSYATALKAFVSDSTVVERRIKRLAVTESAVVESDPPEVDCFAKFCNKTERTGAQYYKSRNKFKRECERRRAPGGGRPRVCTTVREMLAMWYNIIRHSVDVRIMCRFPKKGTDGASFNPAARLLRFLHNEPD